jgi:hypothetical protein
LEGHVWIDQQYRGPLHAAPDRLLRGEGAAEGTGGVEGRELALIDLRKKYTEEHPRVRVVKAGLDEIKLLLNSLEGSPFRLLTVGT